MVAKIKSEMSVGLTPEIESALKVATDFVGMKPSQFGRQQFWKNSAAKVICGIPV